MFRGNFGDVKDEPRSITSGEFDEDEMDDETFAERLVGLTEMFPDPVRSLCCNVGYYGFEGTKKLFSVSSQIVWIAATSFAVLALPIMFENERTQLEQNQQQQQRQMLLGPNVTIAQPGQVPRSA